MLQKIKSGGCVSRHPSVIDQRPRERGGDETSPRSSSMRRWLRSCAWHSRCTRPATIHSPRSLTSLTRRGLRVQYWKSKPPSSHVTIRGGEHAHQQVLPRHHQLSGSGVSRPSRGDRRHRTLQARSVKRFVHVTRPASGSASTRTTSKARSSAESADARLSYLHREEALRLLLLPRAEEANRLRRAVHQCRRTRARGRRAVRDDSAHA